MTATRSDWRGQWVRAAGALLAVLALVMAPAPAVADDSSAPSAAPAEMIYALTGSGTLVRFSSASPGIFNLTVPISGLPAGVALVAIDFRPSTSQLYALGLYTASMNGRLFVINVNTGATSPLTTTSFYSPLDPILEYDMDFNPGVDRVRVINQQGLNLRVNPNNGALSGQDVDLHSSITTTQKYAAVAYAPGKPGQSASTAYVYEYLKDRLFMLGGPDGVPSANTGALTPIGLSGVTSIAKEIGLDIANSGVAYVSLQANNRFSLYTLNLDSGAVTLIGNILDGLTTIKDIAVVPRFSNFLPVTRR